MNQPFVSVIIPVFNGGKELVCCLDALRAQTYASDRFEALVVDNGSTDDTVEVASNYPFVKVVKELKPSSYAARNTGIVLARGEILAFTDADCIPTNNWLETAVARLNEQNNIIVVGNISMFTDTNPTSVELFDMADSFPQGNYVENWKFGPTANLIAHKRTFDQVGNFDGDLKSCGDVQWGQRASKAGFDLVYADDVVVRHPAKRTIDSLMSRVRRIAGGVEDLQREHPTTTHPMKTSLLRQLLPPINYCKMVLRSARKESPINKLKIVGIVFAVRYLGTLERLRLRLGGVSTRG